MFLINGVTVSNIIYIYYIYTQYEGYLFTQYVLYIYIYTQYLWHVCISIPIHAGYIKVFHMIREDFC